MMAATAEAGEAELAEMGVAGVEGVVVHGTAALGLGTVETLMAGAPAGTDIGIGMHADGGAYGITGGQAAQGAQIPTPHFALKYDAEEYRGKHETQEQDGGSERCVGHLKNVLGPDDK